MPVASTIVNSHTPSIFQQVDRITYFCLHKKLYNGPQWAKFYELSPTIENGAEICFLWKLLTESGLKEETTDIFLWFWFQSEQSSDLNTGEECNLWFGFQNEQPINCMLENESVWFD